MIKIASEQIVFCDVDDTLVMWGKPAKGTKTVKIIDPYDGTEHVLRKHLGHMKILRDRKNRGSFIVVWSAGGYKWAEAVVKALHLTEYVDMISSKPFMYMDDKQAADIMGERVYLDIDSPYGT